MIFIKIVTYMMIMIKMKRILLYPAGHQDPRVKTQFYGQLVNAVMLNEPDKPANFKEAMEGPESEKWLEAMKSEIDSMYANKVWTLVDIPEDRKAVENK